MYHILVVDDEARIRTMIKTYAEFEGHQVSEAGDGMQAVLMCRQNQYDIIIMDIMMPVLDGFSACRMIRENSNVPIIMLSARGEEYDRINGLECGVDDYVVKPFSNKELMLRVEAIMKRTKAPNEPQSNNPANEVYSFDEGNFVVDMTARVVTIGNQNLEMSPKEYDLLFYFIKNQNIALKREVLIERVWGYDYYGDERTLDTHIKLLRKKLGAYADYIITVRGIGYRFSIK